MAGNATTLEREVHEAAPLRAVGIRELRDAWSKIRAALGGDLSAHWRLYAEPVRTFRRFGYALQQEAEMALRACMEHGH